MRRKRIVVTMRVVWQILLHAVRGEQKDVHKAIFDGFLDLGGVYIKFLQVLSLNSKFMSQWNSADKFKVFDDVKPDELNLQDFLDKELSPELRKRLASTTNIPFAAGSFAQVYEAILDDGTEVVLKVQRPSLEQFLAFDLKLLQVFVWVVNFIGSDLLEGMNDVFKDFKKATLDETNYYHERDFCNMMHEHYADHPFIVIPYTYPELSTGKLLVQQKIDGLPVTKLIEMYNSGHNVIDHVKKQLGSDLEWQLELVGTELIYGVFTLEAVQGDPHPGNILLLEGNKVGIIDFGVSAPPPKDLLAFLELLRGFVDMYSGDHDVSAFLMRAVRFFARDLYRAMMTIAKANNDYDASKKPIHETFQEAVSTAFESNSSQVDVRQMIEQGNIYRLINETVNENNRFAIKMNVDGALMLRASNIFMAMLTSLGMKREVMTRTFQNVITTVENGPTTLIDTSVKNTSISEAVEIIAEWLENIAEKDPALSKKLSESVRSRV